MSTSLVLRRDAEARLNNKPVYRDERDPVLCIRPVRDENIIQCIPLTHSVVVSSFICDEFNTSSLKISSSAALKKPED